MGGPVRDLGPTDPGRAGLGGAGGAADPNLELMMRYNRLWEPGRLDGAGEVLAPSFRRHGSSGSFIGVEAFRRYVQHFLGAFPDGRFVPEDLTSVPGKVVVRYRFRGTHHGAFLGVPPTGRPVAAGGMAIYGIEAGRVAELWDYLDMLRLVAGDLPYPVDLDF